MSLNWIDVMIAVYVVWGVWRGRRRGMTSELSRLICLLLAILTGYTLVRWTGRVLGEYAVITGHGRGPIAALSVMMAAIYLAGWLRDRLRMIIETRYPGALVQRRMGGVFGGFRTLVIGCTVTVFIGLMPIGFLGKPFSTGSWFGRTLIRYVVPVYEEITE